MVTLTETSRSFGKVNFFMERWIAITIPALILVGVGLHLYLKGMTNLTPFLFMYLTFVSSLGANIKDFKELYSQKLSVVSTLVLLHVIVPVCAFYSAKMLFPHHPGLVAGLTLLMALPVGVTSIFWVGYVGASLVLALAFVSLDTLISPFVVPMSLHFLLGSTVSVNGAALVLSLIKLVVIPSVLGMIVGARMKNVDTFVLIRPIASTSSKVCLYIIVILNAALIAGDLNQGARTLIEVTIVVMILMLVGYLLALLVLSLLCKQKDSVIALTYSGGIRNYTVGVVIATTFFSPTTAFPVLMAMLLQHPIALLFNYFFRMLRTDS